MARCFNNLRWLGPLFLVWSKIAVPSNSFNTMLGVNLIKFFISMWITNESEEQGAYKSPPLSPLGRGHLRWNGVAFRLEGQGHNLVKSHTYSTAVHTILKRREERSLVISKLNNPEMSRALEGNELLKLRGVWVYMWLGWGSGTWLWFTNKSEKNRLSISIVTGNGLGKFNPTSLKTLD